MLQLHDYKTLLMNYPSEYVHTHIHTQKSSIYIKPIMIDELIVKAFTHPLALIESETPIEPVTFMYHHQVHLRISFKLGNGNFVPVTFVCDCAAPSAFYFGEKTLTMLTSLLRQDENTGF